MASAVENQEPLQRLAQVAKIKDATEAVKESVASQSSSESTIAANTFFAAAGALAFLVASIYTIQKPIIQNLFNFNGPLAFGTLLLGAIATSFACEWRIKINNRKNPAAKILALRDLLENYIPLETAGYGDLQAQAREDGHIDLGRVFSWIEAEKAAAEKVALTIPFAAFGKQAT